MNPNRNSLVEVYSKTLNCLLSDIQKTHPSICLKKDMLKIERRIANEGMPFLTKTLPKLGKAIYASFETGALAVPLGFQLKGALPRLMGGLLVLVYDEKGALRDDADALVVKDLLQVCMLFYKIEQQPTKEQVNDAIKTFKATEEALGLSDNYITFLSRGDQVLVEAQAIAKRIIEGFNPFDIIPRHGPGAVATREKAEAKYDFRRLYRKIHSVYPYWEYFLPSFRSAYTAGKWYRSLELLDTGVSKMTFVPKDSRGPRTISMEPLEYQFIQGGLGGAFKTHLERHPLTRGFVNFSSQEVNRQLALSASKDDSFCTLSMKEASDRVSTILVSKVLEGTSLLTALLATRSERVLLPNGELQLLRKFAPMGSNLCFPVEAFIFFVLAKAIQKVEGLESKVFVYGDDIIVDKPTALALFKHFPRFGLMFNKDKSFTQGPFRESCGMDAFKGECITIVKVRKEVPCRHIQGDLVASLFALCRNFYLHGYWQTSAYLEELALPFSKGVGYYPTGIGPGVACAFLRYSLNTVEVTGVRKVWDEAYQRYNYRVKDYCDKHRSSALAVTNPTGKLLSCLTKQSCDEYTVPHTVKPKMRWIFPYGKKAA